MKIRFHEWDVDKSFKSIHLGQYEICVSWHCALIYIYSISHLNQSRYVSNSSYDKMCTLSLSHKEFQNMLFSRDQRKYWFNVSFASTKTNMWNVRTKAIVFASCFLLFLCVSKKIQLKGRANRILELLQKF